MTSLLFWNCRGAKKVEAVLYLKEVIKDHRVFFVGLLETKISSLDNSQILKFLGNDWESFVIPAVGLSGGLMVLWRKDIAAFSIIETSSQMIVGKMEVLREGSWIVASVYGSTDAQERKILWDGLERHCSGDLLMVVGGDFNCVLSQAEKRGGKNFSMNQGSKDLNSFMINNDLHEVRSMGPRFTWCNNKSGSARILEKLDICLINFTALNIIHLALVKHLPRIASDHCPILLKIFKPFEFYNRDIRYEEVWASYHGAAALVKKIWMKNCMGDPASSLNLKFNRTLRTLFFWSKVKFKNLNLLQNKLKNDILEIQLEESEGWISFDRLQLLRFKINEINITLARLNTWWKQRDKENWMDEADCNSSFFHAFANVRRNNNYISHIMTIDGIVTEDRAVIQRTFS
ncbi:uncharacterized protein LOC110098580 [Dendrobium catenatum]|uniref:uncharacterized protein LOC110098580 n=1 Tax=Dendrobium catenatum TaxID=906689 RepID=UPI0009F2F0F9|nr:uncharacterized protein LOC110098580 [Dendrobium catenatum]